jgi:hypothetical protein
VGVCELDLTDVSGLVHVGPVEFTAPGDPSAERGGLLHQIEIDWLGAYHDPDALMPMIAMRARDKETGSRIDAPRNVRSPGKEHTQFTVDTVTVIL